MRITCTCGYTTHFAIVDGVIRRDMRTHGNAAATLTCFNCNRPLIAPVADQPATRAPDPEPEAPDVKPAKTKTRRNRKKNQ